MIFKILKLAAYTIAAPIDLACTTTTSSDLYPYCSKTTTSDLKNLYDKSEGIFDVLVDLCEITVSISYNSLCVFSCVLPIYVSSGKL